MNEKIKTCSKIYFYIILLLSGIMLVFGWKLFWFLTDDAYIAFRYISNSLLGYGYVWNPPPFLPVEGYTSFLWVFLLDIVWRTSHVTPVESSNYLSLFFAFLILIVSMKIILRMQVLVKNLRYRLLLFCLLSLFLLLNRTFLAWSSSGLETAMFSFFIILWFYCSHYIDPSRILWPFSISASAAMIALTRPDGLLCFAATLFMLGVTYIRKRKLLGVKWILSIFPLLFIPVHFVWRYLTYGEWLPNTYYAKYVSPWFGSGVRYAASFIIEYGFWFAGLIFILTFVRLIKLKNLPLSYFKFTNCVNAITKFFASRYFVVSIVVATLAIQTLYYTFVIGGDHYEYRVYNHLLPFIFLVVVWCVSKLRLRKSVAILLLVIFILFSLPVQWTHWAMTRDRNTRAETHILWVPIAPKWPKPFYWYAHVFDRLQYWLIIHHVCMRHQEHKVFHKFLLSLYPTREEGMKISGEDYPVYPQYPVGVASWVLPHVNILDKWGLNDYIVARGSIRDLNFRRMAHNRRVPKGYVKSFRPNVLVKDKTVTVFEREEPLTKEDIIQVERIWRQKIKNKNL